MSISDLTPLLWKVNGKDIYLHKIYHMFPNSCVKVEEKYILADKYDEKLFACFNYQTFMIYVWFILFVKCKKEWKFKAKL